MKKLLILCGISLMFVGAGFAQNDTLITESGLKILIIENGTGFKPSPGSKVWVNYVGYLSDGTEFDNSEGYPLKFTVGKHEVILGWEEGVTFLQKGGKAKIWVPSELGYGEKGYPAVEGVDMVPIPPNADLMFEIELTKVK